MKHALLHPYNLPLLVVVMTVGAISGNLSGLFAAVAAELVLLTLISRMGFFRRHIEEMLEQAERAEAAKIRATVLLRMEEKHRQELESLECLIDRTKANLTRRGSPEEGALEEYLGLNRLTDSYVRLAIAYKRSNDSLQNSSRQLLEQEMRSLEAAAPHASERTRELAEQRLAIARRRAERWDKTREDLDAIVHQLAMIRELIHLMHEQSTAAFNLDDTSAEIEQFIANLEGHQTTIREIAELAFDDAVDNRAMELGRVQIPTSP